MKISLNWIFDHIKGAVSDVDVAKLVDTFIKTTAEIEGWKKVELNVDLITLAEVTTSTYDAVVVCSSEHKKEYTMSARADAVVGLWYLIVVEGGRATWATSVTLGGTKDMMLPCVDVSADVRSGGWKLSLELSDYIIEVDNKSINNRPDLWGHRGVAREIAAILNVSLRPLSELVVQKNIVAYDAVASADAHNPFSVAIQDPVACKRFATLYISEITVGASQLNMIVRLSRVDSRSIDLLVDATNYVMFDVGQPMHVFDADMLQKKQITVARARDKEKLLLLDGETIELTSQDIVIADGGVAISLAGIMGGSGTGVTKKTKSVLLESANFDATTIRRSSTRHKKRTEAEQRFEKSIDPYQNCDALMRFLFLLTNSGVAYQAHENIISLGEVANQKLVTVHHTFIESRLGLLIRPEQVVTILEKLFFTVDQSVEDGSIIYIITIPSFRATKDIKIPEDIVEEIGRCIGYDTLPRVMPALQLHSHDLHTTYTTRAIKRFLSYGLQMRELYGYSFFDESLLRELAWQPTDFVEIKNPISENCTRLVTTLQPHILKAVAENSVHHTQLRFYEWARVWRMQDDTIIEQKSLSGIFFEHSVTSSRAEVDFYSGKAFLTRMFDELCMDVVWRPADATIFPWYSSYQTAVLVHDSTVIGTAGMVDDASIKRISPAGGAAFIFEINADYLLNYRKPVVRLDALSKYPSVRRDVSILISDSVSADTLLQTIKTVDARIESVALIDFFTKPEWKDQKAMTFHVEMCDKQKTFDSDEVELLWNAVIAQLQQQGAVIR